jgi:hypothetical protein
MDYADLTTLLPRAPAQIHLSPTEQEQARSSPFLRLLLAQRRPGSRLATFHSATSIGDTQEIALADRQT